MFRFRFRPQLLQFLLARFGQCEAKRYTVLGLKHGANAFVKVPRAPLLISIEGIATRSSWHYY